MPTRRTATSSPSSFGPANTARANISLATSASGQLQLRRNTDVLWTATDIEPTNTWLHYELNVVFDHTANGALTLRRNGQVIATRTKVQTRIASTDVIDAVRMVETSGSGQRIRMDDLYICDGPAPRTTTS